MGRIQSSVGLITGIPIQETVDKLLQVAGRPRDLLISRTKTLQTQQTAVTELTAKVLAVQFAIQRLSTASVFEKKTVSTSAPDALSAAITGSAKLGSYQITPVQTAQTHQLLSSGFASRTEPIGAGQVSFRFGRTLDEAVNLDELNGGAGVERGKIRFTDRSGETAVVDLRFAQTIDDVVTAINNADGVNVTATVVGDRLQLTDDTGQTLSNLKVQEVDGGRTAADLGLAGINVADNQALGGDVLYLHSNLALSALNDGNGVDFSDALDDLEISLRDGTSLSIDFHRLAREEDFAQATTSAAAGENARLTLTAKTKGAEFDGVRIVFVDDAAVTQGNETVVYDDSDPGDKTLTFHIDAGQTTAADVAAAVQGDAAVSALFDASAGGDGQGVIDVADTAVTLGGAAQAATNETSLSDILETFNSADPLRLKAELSGDGDRIVLTDLSADAGGTFAVSNAHDGRTAEQLGLTGAAVAGVITSRRLVGGLKTSLVSSLSGGQGLTLGQISLTDRSGANDTVDLSSAETLDDILAAINAADVNITARVNSGRTGIVLVDESGGTGNLTIADGDATETAHKLNLAIDAAANSVNSGSLDLQVVSRQSTLASLNGGKGVAEGSFLIFNSNGLAKTFNLKTSNVKTVGDLIDLVNGSNIGVKARLNDAGDGIALIDQVGGSQNFRVQEVGAGTTARDLHLLKTAVGSSENGNPAKLIDGSTSTTIEIDADDTLEDLATKINAAQGGVTASIITAGSGAKPHRLSLVSQIAGLAGRVVFDAAGAGFDFEESAAARDALLVYGSLDGGLLVSSPRNTYTDLIEGLSVTVKAASASPVNVSVTTTDADAVSAVKTFVEQYNALRKKLDEQTLYNEENNTSGALFGTNEALRVESELASLVTDRFFGAGSIHSLAEVGINVRDDGTLEFNEIEFKDKYAADPEAVTAFFTTENLGVADKFNHLIETLAGEGSSLLVNRAQALQQKIDVYQERTNFLNERLAAERQRLLTQFYNLELAVSKQQENITALSQIQALPPLTSIPA
jgi:flagellar hook-associated protein 2